MSNDIEERSPSTRNEGGPPMAADQMQPPPQEDQPQAVTSAARLWVRVLIFFIGLPLALMVLVKVYLG